MLPPCTPSAPQGRRTHEHRGNPFQPYDHKTDPKIRSLVPPWFIFDLCAVGRYSEQQASAAWECREIRSLHANSSSRYDNLQTLCKAWPWYPTKVVTQEQHIYMELLRRSSLPNFPFCPARPRFCPSARPPLLSPVRMSVYVGPKQKPFMSETAMSRSEKAKKNQCRNKTV